MLPISRGFRKHEVRNMVADLAHARGRHPLERDPTAARVGVERRPRPALCALAEPRDRDEAGREAEGEVALRTAHSSPRHGSGKRSDELLSAAKLPESATTRDTSTEAVTDCIVGTTSPAELGPWW